MQRKAVLLAVLVVASVLVLVAGAAGASQQSEAYAGTHVSFETTDNAVVDYSVDGAVLVDSVEVESRSSAEQRGSLEIGVGISAETDVQGSAISTETQSETRASIQAESGAHLDAHDSNRGNLVIQADGESQLVGMNLSQDTQAEQESDRRVVVTKDDGTQGVILIAGDGEIVVDNEGNVTAEVEDRSALVYRQYSEERGDDEREQEEMIVDGTAAAEVYVSMAAEGGEQAAADVVQYGEETTVEVVTHSENEIQMTAERAEDDGRVIITSVAEQAFDTAGDIEVTVDGEAAAHVDSHSELRAAAADGENSAYMVRQATTADASADVLVAVNHFSERAITIDAEGDETDDGMPADDDAETDDGVETDDTATADDDAATADDDGPGFGMLAALAALALFVGARFRQ